jgi:hypothetical protein
LDKSKNEIIKQNQRLDRQNTLLYRQRFESTFFQMLSIHFQLLQSTNHMIDTHLTGSKAFGKFTHDFRCAIQDILTFQPPHFDAYKKHFNTYYNNIFPIISNYVQSLQSVYRFIKNSELQDTAEKRYLDILLSYISLQERVFLFYYITLKPDMFNERFEQLSDDLKILMIPKKFLINESHEQLKYPPKQARDNYPEG